MFTVRFVVARVLGKRARVRGVVIPSSRIGTVRVRLLAAVKKACFDSGKFNHHRNFNVSFVLSFLPAAAVAAHTLSHTLYHTHTHTLGSYYRLLLSAVFIK